MSTAALNRVFESDTSELAERLVLIVLADRADENNQCFPGLDDIARRANLHVDTVRRVLARLVEAGELVVLYRVGSSNKYIVTTGLTKQQIEACVRKAWRKSLREVVAANRVAREKLSRSKGNPLMQRQRVDPLTQRQSLPIDAASEHPLTQRQSEPSLTLIEPKKGASDDAVLVPQDSTPATSATLTVTITPTTPASNVTVTDPLEHMFDRHVKKDSSESLLRKAARSQVALDTAITFYRITGIKVFSEQNAKSRLAGAAEVFAACDGLPVETVIKAALARLKASKSIVNDEHSIKGTCAAIAAEMHATPPNPELTLQPGERFVPVFN